MNSLFSMISDQLGGLWKQIREQGDAEGFLPLLRPVAPYDGPLFRSPVTTIGIVLALLATSGVAVTALGVLLIALLALYLLLTEILGITIEVRPFRV